MNVQQAYETLIERLVRWTEGREDIRAAMVIGSRARRDHPADEWSDLDWLFFADDPRPYWQESDWLDEIGAYWLTFLEPTASGQGYERRVLFSGGLDVDFIPVSTGILWQIAQGEVPEDVLDILRRGVQILVDKDQVAETIKSLPIPPLHNEPPSQAEFLNLVQDFWYHTVWVAKHLRRGEIWWAKSGSDSYLKDRLRTMLEWHAIAQHGGKYDTWMRGRFLEQWADPRAVAVLPDIFAHYDQADLWKTLRATMDLFRWLEQETADRLGYHRPLEGERQAAELVESLSQGDSLSG